MSLSCIIIDDEPNAVNLLEMLIQQSTPWQLKAKCYNALEALAFLKGNKVDFIFLAQSHRHGTGRSVAVANQNCVYYSLL
jgi:two-component system LytT family response regulator